MSAQVSLIQLREKQLTARTLYELTTRAAQLTRESQTRLLVNDRSDIARAAGADGVHLTTRSMRADVIRSMFGDDFLIGVSTHSIEEAQAARAGDADFVVWGPVFATGSKSAYGQPQGVANLASFVRKMNPLPVIALGGLDLNNSVECIAAGVRGIAGIGLFQDESRLAHTVSHLRDVFSRK